MPQSLRRLIRPTTAEEYARTFRKTAYSQEGEDLILVSLFDLNNHPDRKGFYVDVGAHQPERLSNTNLLYLRGWSGINVDPFPGGMKLFNKKRPGDINVELGISDRREPLKFYIFNEPVYNGFSEEAAKKYDGLGGARLLRTAVIETMPLSAFLDQYLPKGQPIDFMNIDVEGLSLQVLQSNDWTRYRPSVLAVEDDDLGSLMDEPTEIVTFMRSHGYAPYCKTPLTTFYAEKAEMTRGPFGWRLRKYT